MIKYLDGKFLEKKLIQMLLDTENLIRSILSSGFNHVIFSCDSHLKDEYETLRREHLSSRFLVISSFSGPFVPAQNFHI